MAKVLAVCISEKKGTMKHPVDSVQLKKEHGIIGDAHAGNWHRQVSLLADESVEKSVMQIVRSDSRSVTVSCRERGSSRLY